MALSKRWKTASFFSRVVTRSEGTATRRHFAAITEVPETRPSRFSDSAQLKKRRIPKEVRLNLLWASLGGEPTVLTLTLNLKVGVGGEPTVLTLTLNLKVGVGGEPTTLTLKAPADRPNPL